MAASFYNNVVYFYDVCLDHTDGRMLKGNKFGIRRGVASFASIVATAIQYVSAELLYLHLFTELFLKNLRNCCFMCHCLP